jgi:hypothetical protein
VATPSASTRSLFGGDIGEWQKEKFKASLSYQVSIYNYFVGEYIIQSCKNIFVKPRKEKI